MNKQEIMTLSLSEHVATKGTVITCKVRLKNDSKNTSIYRDVILTYMLPEHISFVEQSVMINGKAEANGDIVTGIYIPEVEIGQEVEVLFAVRIVKDISASLLMSIKGEFFTYTGESWVAQEIYTNSEEIDILRIHVEYQQTIKRVPIADGEIITYIVELSNRGDIPLYHTLFKDSMPADMTLLPESFMIDGKKINSVDLEKGVFIGSFEVNQTKVLVYQIKDLGSKWIRSVENKPRLIFVYQLHKGMLENGIKYLSAQSNEGNSKQIEPVITYKQIEKQLVLEKDSPEIKQINQSIGEVEILDYYPIETLIKIQQKNSRGYKLIVRGNLNIVIDYTTEDSEQNTYVIHKTLPFSTFVLLPRDHNLNAKINLKGIVEDNIVTTINKKELMIVALMRLNLKIITFGN